MPSTTELSTQLGQLLLSKDLKLTTAESCTGGGIASAITDIAGSSQWFERGFVTYSNEAKMELLGVQAETLNQYGAVSEQVAKEMVEGAFRHSHAQVAVSVTGIAGPDGGSEHKPVGTVWFGFASDLFPSKTVLKQFDGDRAAVRVQSVVFGLESLCELIAGD